MDIRSRDNRQSTPLHWACYSKSEIALCYLLAWLGNDLEEQDIEGYTALHLAVKSVDQIKTTRPVRTLLVRGSSRDSVDKQGRRAVDLVDQVNDPGLQQELRVMLKKPRVITCCMVKTPLMLMRKSLSTPMFFMALIILNYLLLSFGILACKKYLYKNLE